MIDLGDTVVNIVRNLIPMRNFMPASAYGLKAISDWFMSKLGNRKFLSKSKQIKFKNFGGNLDFAI